jgi:hypothetical protein
MGTEEPTTTANQPKSEHREEAGILEMGTDAENVVESSVNGLRTQPR